MKLLVVDDEPGLRQSLRLLMTEESFEVAEAADGDKGLARALAEPFDAVLCDVRMPGLDGLEFLRRYRAAGGAALVIMMSAYGSEDAAIAAMKEGAYDYIPKPFRAYEVLLVLRKAEERERLRREVESLRSALGPRATSPQIVAASQAMLTALDVVAKVAPHTTTVLLTGPSGTGKEVLARELHRLSPRSDRAFVAVNCAAIPDALLESELFGHVRGAFTGAVGDHRGLFEEASGGTLFLDEIGEMEPESQVKLLRVLESHAFFRVGGTRRRTVDMRLVAATNRDLAEAIKTGGFRQDLFYRINTITITLPPLRERREDVRRLVEHFLEQNATYGRKRLSDAAMDALERYDWPGNVRELQHAVQRAVILSQGEQIQPADLPEEIRGGRTASATPGGSLEDMERQHIISTLRSVGGHRAKAATVLGIDPKTLYRKIQAYGIVPELYK